MDPITITVISTAIGQGLVAVSRKLLEKGVVEPALEPATDELKQFILRDQRRHEKDETLRNAVETALTAAGAPIGDEDDVQRWLRNVSLDRLASKKNDALRRQVARGILSFTDPDAEPPEDLVIALGWPRSRQDELATLLATLRHQLYTLDEWQPLIEYANEAAKLGVLYEVLARLARLDNVFVETDAGEALRVVVEQQGLTGADAARIEERYRADLVRELRLHDFRGIVQMRRDIRLPLADIYQELRLQTFINRQGDSEIVYQRLVALGEAS